MKKNIKIFQTFFIMILLIIPGFYFNALALEVNNENEYHPESYDIIIWRINRGIVDKDIVIVDYNTAMKIKAEYEQIEENSSNYLEKIEQKNIVMIKYGVLNENDNLKNIKNKQKLDSVFKNKNFNNILKYDRLKLNIVISFIGMLFATVYGPLKGINIGPPFPGAYFTFFQIAEAHGPAEGIGTWFYCIPNFLKIEDNRGLFIELFFSVGLIEYIPFITNWNDEGQFQIALYLTTLGLIGDKEYLP